MSKISDVIAKKAEDGEHLMRQWLDEQSIPFAQIRDGKETFSAEFRVGKAKRPDFLLFIHNIGPIAVDVKFRDVLPEIRAFSLGNVDQHDHCPEIEKTLHFEQISRIPVWFAFYRPSDKTWHWVRATKAKDAGQAKPSGEKKRFWSLHEQHTELVRSYDCLPKALLSR